MTKFHPTLSLPLALTVAFTLASATGAVRATAGDPAGASSTAPAAQDGKGKALVDEHCIKCHGSGGLYPSGP